MLSRERARAAVLASAAFLGLASAAPGIDSPAEAAVVVVFDPVLDLQSIHRKGYCTVTVAACHAIHGRRG